MKAQCSVFICNILICTILSMESSLADLPGKRTLEANVDGERKNDVASDEWTYNKPNWLDPDFDFIHKVKFSRKQLKYVCL